MNYKKTLPLLILFITFFACIRTIDKEVALNSVVDEDRTYFKAHLNHTRDKHIVINFETRYTLAATYLSPEFRASFAARYTKLFNAPQPFLEEASNKLGFFITVFSPEDEGYDLTDNQLWSIQLVTKESTFKPVLVKRLHTKSRWEPFFKDVHKWSKEYLVLFDTPSLSTSEKLMEKNTLKLLVANADAQVNLSW